MQWDVPNKNFQAKPRWQPHWQPSEILLPFPSTERTSSSVFIISAGRRTRLSAQSFSDTDLKCYAGVENMHNVQQQHKWSCVMIIFYLEKQKKHQEDGSTSVLDRFTETEILRVILSCPFGVFVCSHISFKNFGFLH